MISQLAEVMFHFTTSRGRVEAPKSVDGAYQSMNNLRKGNTLSDNNCACLELLMKDIESYEDTASRFWALLREAKGIAPDEPKDTLPAALPPPDRPHPEPRRGGIDLFLDNTPDLALRAVVRMSREGMSNKDMEEVVEIGRDILKMEIKQAEEEA